MLAPPSVGPCAHARSPSGASGSRGAPAQPASARARPAVLQGMRALPAAHLQGAGWPRVCRPAPVLRRLLQPPPRGKRAWRAPALGACRLPPRPSGRLQPARLRRQPLAALGAPPRYHPAPARGRHALAKPVPALAHEPARLVGPFHPGVSVSTRPAPTGARRRPTQDPGCGFAPSTPPALGPMEATRAQPGSLRRSLRFAPIRPRPVGNAALIGVLSPRSQCEGERRAAATPHHFFSRPVTYN
jgi:hypothetical protein